MAPDHEGSINVLSCAAFLRPSAVAPSAASCAASSKRVRRVAEWIPSAPTSTSHVAFEPSAKWRVIGESDDEEGEGRVYEISLLEK